MPRKLNKAKVTNVEALIGRLGGIYTLGDIMKAISDIPCAFIKSWWVEMYTYPKNKWKEMWMVVFFKHTGVTFYNKDCDSVNALNMLGYMCDRRGYKTT